VLRKLLSLPDFISQGARIIFLYLITKDEVVLGHSCEPAEQLLVHLVAKVRALVKEVNRTVLLARHILKFVTNAAVSECQWNSQMRKTIQIVPA
jgi:hypothetical protein